MAGNKRTSFDLKWAKALEGSLVDSQNIPDGEGWLSTLEFCEKYGIGLNRGQRMLVKGVQDGTIEEYRGSKINAEGRNVRRIWYRPKE